MDLRRALPLLLIVAGCHAAVAPASAAAPDSWEQRVAQLRRVAVALEPLFAGLRFVQPVGVVYAPAPDGRAFVVERAGRVWWRRQTAATATTDVLLDIRGRVLSAYIEQGLLGLALHPDFLRNGKFYVDYVADNPPRTIVSEWVAEPGGNADPNSERVLLSIPQPYKNHNGGQLAFGPDGLLYVAMGDGGSAGDPDGNAQDLHSLLGKILRIDVDKRDAGAYGVPATNPFVGRPARAEIFAYGLRNPWRFSFDPANGRLWAADVGQFAWEEVDLVTAGGNYGWNRFEGRHCFPSGEVCDLADTAAPVTEYGHDVGQSITGGFVYHGAAIRGLQGAYVYGDYVSGAMWALLVQDANHVAGRWLDTFAVNISSFGVDADGELIVVTFDASGGPSQLFRLVPR